MMRHKRIEELIQQKLDNEIDLQNEILLKEHFKECQECREYYEKMAMIMDDIKGLTEYFPGLDFNHRVLDRIRVKKPKVISRLIPVLLGSYLATAFYIILSPFTKLYLGKLPLLILPIIKKSLDGLNIAGTFINSFAVFLKINLKAPEFIIGVSALAFVLFFFDRVIKKSLPEFASGGMKGGLNGC